jgi:prepilin-type N-terminal cleavage/methylation domain-containing protein
MLKDQIKLIKKSQKGFTLVEMLVAIAVFMSVMTVAVTALLTIINANRETQAIKTTTDDVTFAIENISKDMRIGGIYKCLGGDGDVNDGPLGLEVKDCSAGSNYIEYTNSSGYDVTYKFNRTTGELIRITNKNDGLGPITEYLISSDSDVHLSSVKFYVIGSDCENGGIGCSVKTQPRVIITISGVISSKGTANMEFDLQTTVSQSIRNG